MTKSEISKGYDKIAHDIRMEKALYKRCINIYRNKYDGKIIDIGCGGGYLLELLAKKIEPTATLYGLDISEEFCRMTKERVPNAYVVKGDAENLPFPPDMFDFVFMIGALEHMQDFNKVLREVSRVLKRDGIYIVLVPNRDWLQYDFYEKLRRIYQPVDDHFFRYREIKELLENNNLTVKRYRGTDCLFYYGWKHRIEQFFAFFLPFLYKKMKHHIFMCVNAK